MRDIRRIDKVPRSNDVRPTTYRFRHRDARYLINIDYEYRRRIFRGRDLYVGISSAVQYTPAVKC